MRKRLITYFIIFEVIIITIVAFSILKKTISEISISPLNSKELTYNRIGNLKHFYEPKANIKWDENPQFLQQLGYIENSKVSHAVNKDTLHQTANYDVKKKDNVYRIVSIGDSFTFGVHVSTIDNYPSQLEDLLNNKCTNEEINHFQVINLGVPGYDIQYTVERYKLRGQKYNPDLVMWFVINDDLKRLNEMQQSEKNYIVKHYLPQGFEVFSSVYKEMQNRFIQNLGGEQKLLNLQASYFAKLNAYFKKNLFIFTFPETSQNHKQFLRSFSKSRSGIYFYDDIPYIDRLKDGHPTAEGYKVIVENLFQYLTKNKLIPCESERNG